MSGFIPAWDTSELPSDPDDLEQGTSIPYQESRTISGSARCAHCASARLLRSETAGRICALLGAIAGGVSGGVKALGVARPYVGGISDPRLHGSVLVSAVTLGVLAGATTGCAAGAALGQRLDAHVLPSYCCLDCGRRFFT
jgi:DNA-directed RNA polymerase subunit RPC12/RpoP